MTDRTDDSLLGGRVALWQRRAGYRVSIDAVLLAAAVSPRAGERILDAGCGTGAVGLCLLAREGATAFDIVGLEAQPDIALMARENAQRNGQGERYAIVEGDLAHPPAALLERAFDQVVSNPPFLDASAGTPSPDASADRANRESALDLAGWIARCLARLRSRGTLSLIQRADRLPAILAALDGKAGEITVLPLWPAAGEPARRVIVRARKGVGGPAVLLPGLTLHGGQGKYTAEAEAILRDAAPLVL
ncbi:MAG: methyltransferase [Alphaproteobacteria bacterium]|nr:methyltransferase [Alphaproteobacteria bacterium]MCW5743581.1 methyltransferase [Alphaproteobacteria bacterium]